MRKNTIFSLFVLNLIIAAGAESLVYAHHDNGCLKQSIVNQALAGLTLHTWNPIDNSWVVMNQINFCDDESIAFKVIKTITYMAELENKTIEQKNNLTSIVFKEGPLTFFKSRVKNIYFEPIREIDSKEDHLCKKAVLAFVPPEVEKRAMHICTQNISSYMDRNTISALFLHEARHLDGFSKFQHVSCLQGDHFDFDKINNITDRIACDHDYESHGSFHIQADFNINVYKLSTDQTEKQSTRAEALSIILNNFNKLPLEIEAGTIVAAHKSKGIRFYPYKEFENLNRNLAEESTMEKKLLPIPREKPKSKISYHILAGMGDIVNGLAMDFQKIVVYTKTGHVYIYSNRSLVLLGPLKIADYFRYSLSTKEQASLVDVFHQTFDINYGCLLMSQSMVCMNNTNQVIYRMEFSNIQPQGFYIYKDPASRFESIYLLDKSNRLYPLPNDFRMLRSFSTEQTLVDFSEQDKILNKKNRNNDSLNILSLLNIPPRDELIPKLLVTPRDTILQKIKTDSTWILGPFYWSPKIEAL